MKRLFWTMGLAGSVTLVACGDDTSGTGTTFTDPCDEAPIQFTTTTLPGATVGVDYENEDGSPIEVSIEGGSQRDVRWGLRSGDALPTGIYPTTRGNPLRLSGRPSLAGTFEFTLEVTDSCGGEPVEQAFTLVVDEGDPELEITTNSLSNGEVDVPYSAQLAAQGGSGEGYIYFIDNPELLPPGLTLSQDGVLSGTPLDDGQYPFTVNVRDSVGNLADRSYTVQIGIEVVPLEFEDDTCPRGKALEPYTCRICLTGGTPPYELEFAGMAEAPPGLRLVQPGGEILDGEFAPPNCGVLTGLPATADNYAFRLFAADSALPVQRNSESFFLDVSPPDAPLRITGRLRVLEQTSENPPEFAETAEELFEFPPLELNREYHFGVVAIGGSRKDYIWTVIEGELPPGFMLMSGTTTATLTGACTRLGQYNPRIQVQDSDGETNVIERFQARCVPQINPIEITTPSLPNGILGQTYTATIAAREGQQPDPMNPDPLIVYGWSSIPSADALPPGLSLVNVSEPGATETVITGTPTSTGTFTFEIQVNDVSNRTDVETYTVEIAVP